MGDTPGCLVESLGSDRLAFNGVSDDTLQCLLGTFRRTGTWVMNSNNGLAERAGEDAIRGYGWNCALSHSSMADDFNVDSTRTTWTRDIFARASANGHFAEFSCRPRECVRLLNRERYECASTDLGPEDPGPLYLALREFRHREVHPRYPIRFRTLANRLASTSALLGLLAILTLHRSASRLRRAPAAPPPESPYRPVPSIAPVDAATLLRGHGRRVVAVIVLHALGSIAAALVISR
jgi:hypothetical protein